MSRKALFLDLDGTLLNDRKEITPGNRAAIEAALAAGHSIVIATGRPLASALTQAERLGLTGQGCFLVTFNGAVLYDPWARKPLRSTTVDLEIVWKLFDEANRRGIHVQTYDTRNVLVEPRCDDPMIRRYCGEILMDFRVIPDVRTLDAPPAKVLLISEEPGPLDSFREWLAATFPGILDSFYSSSRYLEIVMHGLNKGTALTELAGILGIPARNTFAAGDAGNDIEMLTAAGTGIAMINGTDEVKAAADTVTEHDNNHDAIQEIIEKYILPDT